MNQIILGIDPGTRITGYGVVSSQNGGYQPVDFGCIRPPANLKLTDRYLIIYNAVCELLDKFKPAALVVETQFVHKNVSSASKLYMVRGIVIIAAKQRNIPVFEYAPTKTKKAVSGRGFASKEQVQGMVQRLLNLAAPPEPEDAADALALAICHIHHAQASAILDEEI